MDQNNNASNFSFRMFNIYRRFVEVLQIKPEFLENLKSGEPSEEICRVIVSKVFQQVQTEDRILNWIKYLIRNAKLITSHAENLPDTWNEAINYTSSCIKLIRKYLKRNNINSTIDLNSIAELANNISQFIHKSSQKKYVIAIYEYLKYDLHNPVRKIIPRRKHKKSKQEEKKTKQEDKVTETLQSPKIQQNELKMIFKKLTHESQIQDEKIDTNMKITEINDQMSENNIPNKNECNFKNVNSIKLSYKKDILLKRKMLNANESDDNCSIKKLFLHNRKLNSKDDKWANDSYNLHTKIDRYEVVHTKILKSSKNKHITSKESKIGLNHTKLAEKEEFKYIENGKHSEVMNMTYNDISHKLKTIMAFCEYKNVISLEEYLVLCRTRDKINGRSLKEKLNKSV